MEILILFFWFPWDRTTPTERKLFLPDFYIALKCVHIIWMSVTWHFVKQTLLAILYKYFSPHPGIPLPFLLFLISLFLLSSKSFVEMIYFLLVYFSFYSYEYNFMRTRVFLSCFVYQCTPREKIIPGTLWVANRYLLNEWMERFSYETTELILCCSFLKCPFLSYLYAKYIKIWRTPEWLS